VPISAEYPSYILRDNGILSVLTFIDFFTVNAQRTALTIAANCCRAARAEQWNTINELLPTLERLLDYSDKQSKCLLQLNTVLHLFI
jgi:E3 ubiquitin-protein ligase TRIP12